MCQYCDGKSKENVIWQDTISNDWYLQIKTDEWDKTEQEYVYIREYINYCPYCGKKLGEETLEKETLEKEKAKDMRNTAHITYKNWNGKQFLDNVPTKENFIKEFTDLCKKYNVSLSHEDRYGAFILLKGFDQKYIDWLSAASVPDWEEGE